MKGTSSLQILPSHLPPISVIFRLVDIEQSGQTEVSDLHVVWVLYEDVASS